MRHLIAKIEFFNRECRGAIKLFFSFFQDYHRYRRYSLYGKTLFKKDRLETRMMLLAHSLEKGMSFEVKKQGWGKDKSLSLCSLAEVYINQYSLTEEALNTLNVLENYRNDDCSDKSYEVTSRIDEMLSKYSKHININSAGVKQVHEHDAFNKKEILDFYQSRASVRFYSDSPVTIQEAESAMEIAYTTPTACNRQSSKVYYISDYKMINDILDLQYGNQNWADKAKAMFIITGSLSSWGDYYERQQVYIDGGLFTMNFLMGLHLNNIACCCKMFVRDYKLQDRIWKLCNIPKNETPIIIVMAGHYKETPVYDPVSHRFENKLVSVNNG